MALVSSLSLLGAVSLGTIVAPELPPDSATAEPSRPDAASPDPFSPDDPDPTAVPDPTIAPEPTPTPQPTAAAVDTEVAPRAASTAAADDAAEPDTKPVVRSREGLWAMQFTFGGLAPMSIGGINDYGINRLFMTELGFRRVFRNGWTLPFSIGAGVFHHNPEDQEGIDTPNQNDVGLAATVGILKSFRVWRRIAPYGGGQFHLHYLDPTGDNNWNVGLGIGPVLGIEYYVGDRVSLLLQGQAILGFQIFDGLLQVSAATQISAGGQTGLVFYF
jgi:hypothetical protein